ncbi:MAG: hypothetical protein ACPLW7_03210 [Minisyncoccia bacterium]
MPKSPIITIIDLKKEKSSSKKFIIFSKTVENCLNNIKNTNENAIIFINRKALATSIVCQDCGNVIKCPNCDVPLTFHQDNNQNYLLCHHCNYKTEPPLICPICQSHRLIPLGLGTERLDLELKKMGFANKKIAILEGDLKDKTELDLINKFNQKEINILITTEAIFRPQLKQSDYIIIPNIDNLLFFPDYQNEEKIFNILLKLKNITKKEMFIQTINTKQRVIDNFINNNIEQFYQEELEWRKIYHWPPFYQIIKLTLETKNQEKGNKEALDIAYKLQTTIKKLNLENRFQLLGPVPAFIFKEKNVFHFNILIKMSYNTKDIPRVFDRIVSLNTLEPILSKEDTLLRNKILLSVPLNWKIDINPKSIL